MCVCLFVCFFHRGLYGSNILDATKIKIWAVKKDVERKNIEKKEKLEFDHLNMLHFEGPLPPSHQQNFSLIQSSIRKGIFPSQVILEAKICDNFLYKPYAKYSVESKFNSYLEGLLSGLIWKRKVLRISSLNSESEEPGKITEKRQCLAMGQEKFC